MLLRTPSSFFFFFNDTATTEIYTLSLHDALPICIHTGESIVVAPSQTLNDEEYQILRRSEEHTSELQSLAYLVCRLLLEKKKKQQKKSETLNRTTTLCH